MTAKANYWLLNKNREAVGVLWDHKWIDHFDELRTCAYE